MVVLYKTELQRYQSYLGKRTRIDEVEDRQGISLVDDGYLHRFGLVAARAAAFPTNNLDEAIPVSDT